MFCHNKNGKDNILVLGVAFVSLVVLLMNAHGVASSALRLDNATWGKYPAGGYPPPQRAYPLLFFVDGSETAPVIGMFFGTQFVRDLSDGWLWTTSGWDAIAMRGGISQRYGVFSWQTSSAIYVFGGINLIDGVLGDLWRFTWDNSLWRFITPISVDVPHARYRGVSFVRTFSLSSVRELYLFGGTTADADVFDLWYFDLGTGGWVNKGRGTGANEQHLVASVDSRSYVGCYDNINGRFVLYLTTTQQFLYLNVTSMVWTAGPNRATAPSTVAWPSTRTLASMTSYYNHMFIATGSNDAGEPLGDIWVWQHWQQTWIIIQNPGGAVSARMSSGIIAVSDNVLMLVGGLDTEPRNDMYYMANFTIPPGQNWYTLQLYADVKIPDGRSFHSVIKYAGDVYIFGGQSHNEPLAEFWQYEISTFKWSAISTAVQPPARLGHATTFWEEYIFVFGGKASVYLSQYFNDMWAIQVQSPSRNWVEVEPVGGAVPSARAFMGYTHLSNKDVREFYIYGGITDEKVVGDFWKYNFMTEAWTVLLSTADPGPRQACAMSSNDTHIFLVGGESDRLVLTSSIWIYTLKRGLWSRIPSVDLPVMYPSMIMVRMSPANFVIVGGERQGQVLPYGKDVYLLNEDSLKLQNLSSTPPRTAAGGVMVGNFLLTMGGHIPSSNGDTSTANAVADVYLVSVGPICHNGLGETCFGCPPGTYADGSQCSLCPAGTYNSGWGTESCTKCPAGRYATTYGNELEGDCLSCPSGTWANSTGQTTCDPCPTFVEDVCTDCICPVGAFVPVQRETRSLAVTAIQPNVEAVPDDREHVAIEVTYFVTLGLIFIIFAVYAVLRLLGLSWLRWLRRLDLFMADEHITRDMFMRRIPTTAGGMCSVFVVLLTLAVIVGVLLVPIISSGKEVRTVIPRMVMESLPREDFVIQLILHGFSGHCVQGATCLDEFTFKSSNFDVSTVDPDVTCEATPTQCVITWTCYSCRPKESSPKATYSFSTTSSLSAESIEWRIKSMTGHTGMPSEIRATLHPAPGSEFRGVRIPSTVTAQVLLNTKRTTLETLGSSLQGYLVYYSSSTTGSEYKGGTIDDDGLAVNFNLIFSSAAIVDSIDRHHFNSFIAVMVFGALPGMVSLMVMTFRFFERVFLVKLFKALRHTLTLDAESYDVQYDDGETGDGGDKDNSPRGPRRGSRRETLAVDDLFDEVYDEYENASTPQPQLKKATFGSGMFATNTSMMNESDFLPDPSSLTTEQQQGTTDTTANNARDGSRRGPRGGGNAARRNLSPSSQAYILTDSDDSDGGLGVMEVDMVSTDGTADASLH
eukprot:PhM_4_TR14159/c0_g1_i1/m.51526